MSRLCGNCSNVSVQLNMIMIKWGESLGMRDCVVHLRTRERIVEYEWLGRNVVTACVSWLWRKIGKLSCGFASNLVTTHSVLQTKC